ncbi:MAG: ABC transporter permease [Micrococcaceae bacterium]
MAKNKTSFLNELNDAVSVRTLLMLVGVLLLQFGFIASYVGAFHKPKADEIPVAVVAPDSVKATLIKQLNDINGHPVKAQAVASEEDGNNQLKHEDLYGVYVMNPTSTTDKLVVASASGYSLQQAVETTMQQVATAQHRTLTVEDIVPTQEGDYRGLTSFYLVVGWIVGGYLFAALLGVSKGSKPINLNRAIMRIGAIVPYAFASGFGAALIVDKQLGALTGHIPQLGLIGTLLVLSAATVTMAFQSLFGVIGIGLTVLVFVVLGNPSAGGPYQSYLLPEFWRNIGGFLPNGAGTSAVRSLVYFDGVKTGSNIAVIATWAIAGALITLVVAKFSKKSESVES